MDSLALLEETLCTELFTNLELSINKLALLIDEESKEYHESKEQMIIPLPATCLPVTVLFTGASYEKQSASRKTGSPASLQKLFSGKDKENSDDQLSSKSHTSTYSLKKKCDSIGDLNVNVCHTPVGVDLTQLQCQDKTLQITVKESIALENKLGNKYSLQNFVKSVASYYQEQDNSHGKPLSMKRSKVSIQKRKQRDFSEDNNEMKKEENERVWFPCKKCHFEFSTAKGLANHVKTHPKKMIEKNSCVYCRKCLDDEEALRNHLHDEHIYEITNYTCESCKIECISGDLFDKHQYFCHRSNSETCFLCANCDKVYYNEELYAFHKEHQKYCHICSVNFCMSSEQYKTHKAKHILHTYKCLKCNASFITKAALTKHLESKNLSHSTGMKSCSFSCTSKVDDSSNILDSEQADDVCLEDQDIQEEKQKEKHHSCPICSSTFIRIKNLISHMSAVHPEDIQDSSLQNLTKHECTKCDKKFTKRSNLLSHLATHIRGIGCENGQPTCSICHKTFRLQRYLVDHMRLHTGRGTHQCPHCDKKFLRISHLKLHIEMHDNFHKSHSCNHCNKKYMRKQDLTQHIRVKHNNASLTKGDAKEFEEEKGFPCSQCNVYFPTTLKLQMHEVTHIVSKPPFKCQECSKEFMSLSALKRHYMIHWDIKPFSCITCKRKFRYSQSLQRHMVTHTGEKAHKCNHCGKSFALKGTLHTHMQQHNTQKIFTCSKCGESFINKLDQKAHYCRQNAADESTDISCPEYNVFNKAIKYIECGQIDSTKCDEQSETVDEQLGNIVSNTLSDMTEVTHLITDSTISDIPSVAELVPNSMSSAVGQLIAHVSGNIVCLNESVPDTSFPEMLPQIHKNSGLVEEILEHSSSENTFENSTLLGVSNIPRRHDNDVLSQAFDVMGDNIMTECVNLDSQAQLPSSHDNTGTESTIYTLVSVDGDTSQPVLINIPSIDSAGAEENVTLQINFPENGCSEVFIIKG